MLRYLDPSTRRWLVVGLVLTWGMVGTTSTSLAQTATGTATAAAMPTDTPTPAPTDTPVPTLTPTVPAPATPEPAAPGLSTLDPNIIPLGGGGGPRNLVKVQNLQDYQLRVDGNVQLGRIPEPVLAPANVAEAYSSCVGCQTLAVALQIDVITADSRVATPKNLAVAVNYGCTNCRTLALALQYVLTVDDPTQVPDEVNQLVAQMRQELKQMNGDQSLTLGDAEARVVNVVNQFNDLAMYLDQQRDESTDPTTPNAAPPA